MRVKQRSHFVPIFAVLATVTGIPLTGTPARADLLVSSYPDAPQTGPAHVSSATQVGYGAEVFGRPALRSHFMRPLGRTTTRAVSPAVLQAFLKHLGAGGMIMTFFPPGDFPGGSTGGSTGGPTGGTPPPTTPPPPTTTVTGSTGGGPHVSSTPEPCTLIAGLTGAALVGLLLLWQYKKKTVLAFRP